MEETFGQQSLRVPTDLLFRAYLRVSMHSVGDKATDAGEALSRQKHRL
ncbi:hypothetical protein GGP90_002274 [Salinibacter ruber]|nr:hypothetical protein [Salinibacter ruber]